MFCAVFVGCRRFSSILAPRESSTRSEEWSTTLLGPAPQIVWALGQSGEPRTPSVSAAFRLACEGVETIVRGLGKGCERRMGAAWHSELAVEQG